MKLRTVRRVVTGLTLAAALIAVTPASSEAAGFGRGTMVSLWALSWDWLASVGEKLGWTAVPERAPSARRNGGPARVWDKQGSMVDPNGCQSPSGTSSCTDNDTQLQPKT